MMHPAVIQRSSVVYRSILHTNRGWSLSGHHFRPLRIQMLIREESICSVWETIYHFFTCRWMDGNCI